MNKKNYSMMISLMLLLAFFTQTAFNQNAGRLDKYFSITVSPDDKCGYDEQTARMQLEILGDHWGYGYDSLLTDLPVWQQSPYVVIDSLGASVQNRAIWQLTITANSTPSEPRRVIHIHARTHPNEVQAFWVTDEIIRFLLSEQEFAQFLRDRCVFYIIPMYNPDGVELEYPRQNANGIDLESNWNAGSVQPEVALLRNRFIELMSSATPIEVALNMHSSTSCRRYFVYHAAAGTSVPYTVMEQDYIGGIRSYFPGGIESWNYFVSWTSGTPTQYPESWFWLNHAESVMALTYEDMNCTSAGSYDQTAYAMLHGTADYLGLVNTALITDERPVRNQDNQLVSFPNPINLSQAQSLPTIVQFTLNRPQNVRLSVYDVLGREIKLLDEGYRNSGEHRIFYASDQLPNGIYFFSLQTEEKQIIRKFSVIR